jgi:predicted Zn-dependent peptidase
MKEIKIKSAGEVIYEHTCKNGLKVYVWKYDLSEEISLSLTVKYGSIHTDFKYNGKTYNVPNGIAHYLEHVKFNEDNELTAHDYYYKIGSYTNAYTTYDHTSYEVVCNENIKDNLEHLLYFVFNPFFTKKLISKEKSIIIEEAKMSLNNPYNLGYLTLMNNLYQKDHKKYLITGNPDEIKKIELEDIETVFNAFYKPDNMFLTVTGNVNPYEVEKIVDEYFDKNIIENNNKSEIINIKEPDKVIKEKEEINVNVQKEKLLMSLKIPKKNYKQFDDLHLRIFFNIICDCNFGSSSNFNEYLITNNIVDDIYYMVSVDDNHIIITFESSTSYPNELSKLIKDKLNNLEVCKEDFIRKNKILIASSILGYEDASDVNTDIRENIIKYNKIIDNIGDIFKELKYEDLLKIIELLKKYEISEVILKPLEKTNQID